MNSINSFCSLISSSPNNIIIPPFGNHFSYTINSGQIKYTKSLKNGYYMYSFACDASSSAVLTVTPNYSVNNASILMVAGGGGGFSRAGDLWTFGGGGGGGVGYGNLSFDVSSNYTFTIGSGGVSGNDASGTIVLGKDTSIIGGILNERAYGGGGGMSAGGSGAGGINPGGTGPGTTFNGFSPTRGIGTMVYVGCSGGNGYTTTNINSLYGAGGGGGAGGIGSISANGIGGNGGPPFMWSVDGSYYSAGGGGGGYWSGGLGGSGGGKTAGNGTSPNRGTAGSSTMYGGGGGGGCVYANSRGGNGGNGIIIIALRYPP
jgi:hypothetical protein